MHIPVETSTTSNGTIEVAGHVVAGHRDPEGCWHLECDTCGWTVVTGHDLSDEALDALIDDHRAV